VEARSDDLFQLKSHDYRNLFRVIALLQERHSNTTPGQTSFAANVLHSECATYERLLPALDELIGCRGYESLIAILCRLSEISPVAGSSEPHTADCFGSTGVGAIRSGPSYVPGAER